MRLRWVTHTAKKSPIRPADITGTPETPLTTTPINNQQPTTTTMRRDLGLHRNASKHRKKRPRSVDERPKSRTPHARAPHRARPIVSLLARVVAPLLIFICVVGASPQPNTRRRPQPPHPSMHPCITPPQSRPFSKVLRSVYVFVMWRREPPGGWTNYGGAKGLRRPPETPPPRLKTKSMERGRGGPPSSGVQLGSAVWRHVCASLFLRITTSINRGSYRPQAKQQRTKTGLFRKNNKGVGVWRYDEISSVVQPLDKR
jgi:hypothetical protein